MKRKRGNKKGKPKKPPLAGANKAVQNVASVNAQDDSGLNDFDNEEFDSGMEAETPSSTGMGVDQPEKCASINSVGLADKTPGKLVYNRVKVKIKTSKTLDSQHTSSDATTQSDTDKGSQQVGQEKQGVISEKMEDSANSLSEGVLGNSSKKSAGIKIKSSRGFSASSINPCSNSGMVHGERIHQKEQGLIHRTYGHNREELNAALEVIEKVMKMDAAEPFNVPVNPVELGIPDYFDVIDSPMDFGTIRNNLENGVKYINSEDVFKDVQYIWDNCYKYNNKGDYILELMKRVKKNFMKCWTAAGLYTEQPHINGADERDVASSSHGKIAVKSDQSKNKTRKRPGIKWHKDDCLCAICVMMRRKHNREENVQTVDDQTDTSDDHLAQQVELEEISPVESPCEDISSDMDNSPDADSEEMGEEVKLVNTKQLYSPQLKTHNEMTNQVNLKVEFSEEPELGDKPGEVHNRQHQIPTFGSDGNIQNDTRREQMPPQQQNGTSATEQQKHKELLGKRERAEIYENIRRFENPMLLGLCGTLLPNNRESVWNGPHSLVKHQTSSSHKKSIHEAIKSFLS